MQAILNPGDLGDTLFLIFILFKSKIISSIQIYLFRQYIQDAGELWIISLLLVLATKGQDEASLGSWHYREILAGLALQHFTDS